MERVSGIGGMFFAADDPEMLADWYSTHLGVDPPPGVDGARSWRQDAGPTVFTAMRSDSPHFGASKSWSINFRVNDLDAMVAQLRDGGIAVEVDPEHYSYGRFADLTDPEGNGIQLWQVAGTDAVE